MLRIGDRRTRRPHSLDSANGPHTACTSAFDRVGSSDCSNMARRKGGRQQRRGPSSPPLAALAVGALLASAACCSATGTSTAFATIAPSIGRRPGSASVPSSSAFLGRGMRLVAPPNKSFAAGQRGSRNGGGGMKMFLGTDGGFLGVGAPEIVSRNAHHNETNGQYVVHAISRPALASRFSRHDTSLLTHHSTCMSASYRSISISGGGRSCGLLRPWANRAVQAHQGDWQSAAELPQPVDGGIQAVRNEHGGPTRPSGATQGSEGARRRLQFSQIHQHRRDGRSF